MLDELPPDLPPFDQPSDDDAPPEASGDNVFDLHSGAKASTVDRRPGIRITHELHEVVDEAVQALVYDPQLYQRDGSLVMVARANESDEASDLPWAKGTPTIRQLSAPTMRERLTGAAKWYRFHAQRNGGWRPALPTDHVVQATLARGRWPGVRQLVGVTECPIFHTSGEVRTEPGYDFETGYLHIPNDRFVPPPANPTLEDAEKAFAELRDLFVDFPCRSDVDRDVAIACLLTLIARPAILGAVPGFIFDASTPGSGKSLIADVVATIATGRGVSRMSWPEDDPAELEKAIAGYALQGAAAINFDNVTTTFGGGCLDRALTAHDTIDIRVLGRSEVPTLRWRAVIIASGNNIMIRGDTHRRVLIARLEPDTDRPEDRTDFKHPRILDWARRERPRLVRAALTLLAAYCKAKRPKQGALWGSFEAWSELVPSAIRWAGGTWILDARSSQGAEHEAESSTKLAILDAIARIDPGKGVTARTLCEVLYPHGKRPQEPDHYNTARDAIEELTRCPPGKAPTSSRMGWALRAMKGRWVGNRQLVSTPGHAGVVCWLVRVKGEVGMVGIQQAASSQTEEGIGGDGGDKWG